MFNILYGAAAAVIGVKITKTTINNLCKGPTVDEDGKENKPDYVSNAIFTVAGAALVIKGAKLIIEEIASN